MAALSLREFLDAHYEPRDLLTAFLGCAERHMRGLGMDLFIDCDFSRLLHVNEENRQHKWFAVMPMFDPNFCDLDDWARGFWIEGRNHRGETVVAQSARRYKLPRTTLQEEMTSLRFFYDRPEESKGEGETLRCGSPSSAHIRSNICYSGGTWVHPDFRGRELAAILPRISRCIAHMLWETDYTISLVEHVLAEKGVVRRYGYKRVEPGIEWKGNPGQGDLSLALIWMDRPEMLSDIQSAMAIEVQALV